jgi:hypothetical protein
MRTFRPFYFRKDFALYFSLCGLSFSAIGHSDTSFDRFEKTELKDYELPSKEKCKTLRKVQDNHYYLVCVGKNLKVRMIQQVSHPISEDPIIESIIFKDEQHSQICYPEELKCLGFKGGKIAFAYDLNTRTLHRPKDSLEYQSKLKQALDLKSSLNAAKTVTKFPPPLAWTAYKDTMTLPEKTCADAASILDHLKKNDHRFCIHTTDTPMKTLFNQSPIEQEALLPKGMKVAILADGMPWKLAVEACLSIKGGQWRSPISMQDTAKNDHKSEISIAKKIAKYLANEAISTEFWTGTKNASSGDASTIDLAEGSVNQHFQQDSHAVICVKN